MTTIRRSDLLWLAGLLEGDGYFGWKSNRSVIKIELVDEDVVEKVSTLMGTSCLRVAPRKNGWKPLFLSSLNGSKASAWMRVLLPYMGKRRALVMERSLRMEERKKTERILINPFQGKTLAGCFDRATLAREVEETSYRHVSKKYGVSHESVRRIVLDLDNKSRPRHGKPHRISVQHCVKVIDDVCDGGELFWLAGLLEAEGSFMKGTPSRPGSPILSLQMTDLDVVKRALRCANSKRKIYFYEKRLRNPRHKDVFMWSERGKYAVSLMEKLAPLMGERRRAQIKAALACFVPNGRQISCQKRATMKRVMTDRQVLDMWQKNQKGASLRSLALEYGVHHETLRYAIKNLVPRLIDVTPHQPMTST